MSEPDEYKIGDVIYDRPAGSEIDRVTVTSATRRACRECDRDEDYAMEDGSWICRACGAVS